VLSVGGRNRLPLNINLLYQTFWWAHLFVCEIFIESKATAKVKALQKQMLWQKEEGKKRKKCNKSFRAFFFLF